VAEDLLADTVVGGLLDNIIGLISTTFNVHKYLLERELYETRSNNTKK